MSDGLIVDIDTAKLSRRLEVERMRAEIRSLRIEKWLSYLAAGALTLVALSVIAALVVAVMRATAKGHF